MNIINRRKKIIEELKDKEYRDAFAVEHIDTGIPFQIRALREQREWTQIKLGDMAGMAQGTISRFEDPNDNKLTLQSLKRLASAFDVALMVRFVPFSELVEWELHLSPNSLRALSHGDEPYFKEQPQKELESLQKEVAFKIPQGQYQSVGNVDYSFTLQRKEQMENDQKVLKPSSSTQLNKVQKIHYGS